MQGRKRVHLNPEEPQQTRPNSKPTNNTSLGLTGQPTVQTSTRTYQYHPNMFYPPPFNPYGYGPLQPGLPLGNIPFGFPLMYMPYAAPLPMPFLPKFY